MADLLSAVLTSMRLLWLAYGEGVAWLVEVLPFNVQIIES